MSTDNKIPEYGVCDTPTQLARRFPDFSGVLWMLPIYRADQDSEWDDDIGCFLRGWRWRKWGPYVGEFDQVHYDEIEYLEEADGTNGYPPIDVQWVFSNRKPGYMEDRRQRVEFANGKVKN
jgi:hypothetical protein